MGVGVERVEGDGVHVGTMTAQLLGGLFQGGRGASREPHRARAARDQPACGGERDLGRTAEDEQGLGEAEGVLHGSSS